MKKGHPWRSATLGDVLDIESTAILPEPGVSYRYLGLENIEQNTGRILEAPETDGAAIESQKYIFAPSHVLYGKLRPNLNKVATPDFAGVCSTDILPLAIRRDALPEFVGYFLRSPSFVHHAVSRASGTKMPRFGPRQLLRTEIDVPPLSVQRRIVQILRRADQIRAKRKEALSIVDAVLPASFMAMFGNSTHFDRVPLGELADVRSGVTKGRSLKGRKTVDVPYLRVANVQDGFLDLAEVKTIEVSPEELEKYRLEDGDILMTEGGDPDKLGRGAIWRNQVEGCILQNHVFRVRPKRSRLAPEYLAALLRTPEAKRYFLSCAKRSSNLASINSSQVKAFPVPLPPLYLQEKFVTAVDQWLEASQRLTDALRDANWLFDSLVDQAFAGTLTREWEMEHAAAIAGETAIEDVLPRLVLLAIIRECHTRSNKPILMTAFMKYVFLAQMEGATRRQLYRFVPYLYGPFAKQLYVDLQELVAEGIVRVENDREEEQTRITLTNGAKAADILATMPPDLAMDVQAIIETYGGLSHKELLKNVYRKYPAYTRKSKISKTVAE